MTNVRNILFPTDFSHTGDAALTLAMSLARDSGATLHIIHVEEPPMAYGSGRMYYGMLDPTRDELQEMLTRVVPSGGNVPHVHHLIIGQPAEAICQFAAEKEIDMIVMGTHGRSGALRMLVGSVAERVVRDAPCPVLVYKNPDVSSAKVGK